LLVGAREAALELGEQADPVEGADLPLEALLGPSRLVHAMRFPRRDLATKRAGSQPGRKTR
ncbi:MAG: hypothetical protein ACREA0_28000, partial [bacterium]